MNVVVRHILKERFASAELVKVVGPREHRVLLEYIVPAEPAIWKLRNAATARV